jgi:hypothetical protein
MIDTYKHNDLAPITLLDVVLKKQDVWNGKYKEINFEIVRWRMTWNYYIFLNFRAMPPKHIGAYTPTIIIDEKDRSYTQASEAINNIPMHGGVTYCEFANNGKRIKVGCDYAHLWDEEHTYELSDIVYDLKETIDAWFKIMPDYKFFCNGNGKYYDVNDGTFDKFNNFYSNEYKLTTPVDKDK